MYIDVHSYSQLWMYSFAYTYDPPPIGVREDILLGGGEFALKLTIFTKNKQFALKLTFYFNPNGPETSCKSVLCS